MRIEDFVARADQLLALADSAIATKFTSAGTSWVDAGQFFGFRAAALSFLRTVFGEDHPYYRDFDSRVDRHLFNHASMGREIVAAAKSEVTGGWNIRIRSLVAAELFADFLGMARHLLDSGYKDPAAVITGSVLEEHLRQLCQRHKIDVEFIKNGDVIPKKAELLNAELAKANAYNKLDQKNVTGWLDLRNKAAHGQYDEYNREQVDLMHRGCLEFMARTPP